MLGNIYQFLKLLEPVVINGFTNYNKLPKMSSFLNKGQKKWL